MIKILYWIFLILQFTFQIPFVFVGLICHQIAEGIDLGIVIAKAIDRVIKKKISFLHNKQ